MKIQIKLGLVVSCVIAFVVTFASVIALADTVKGAPSLNAFAPLPPESVTVLLRPTIVKVSRSSQGSARTQGASQHNGAILAVKVAAEKPWFCEPTWRDLQGSTGQYRNCH